jgi:GntR family galactonate operon transcriptional repressor
VSDLTGVAGLLVQGTAGNRDTSKRPQRLATPVIEDFVNQIVSGNFPPGTDLPSEANICRFLGISRTVLREVLKVLEQKGLVRVENGKGTLVTERDEWNLLDPVVLPARLKYDEDGSFLDHLVRVRVALEADMAAEAAEKATAEQIAFMATKIEELQSSINNLERYFRSDRQFHDGFMRASGNELSRAIVLNIYNEARVRLESGLEDARLELSMLGHVDIFNAISAHDPERAAEATRHHISGAWQLKLEKAKPQQKSESK